MGRFFLLTGKFFSTYGWFLLLTVGWLVFFLLTVEIRFGLFGLRWRIGLVPFTYGSPGPEIRFGLFCLRFPPSGNWVWCFFTYGYPTVSKKDEPEVKRPQL